MAERNRQNPIVRFREKTSVNEVGCVHELLHLKLLKLGFPNVRRLNLQENNSWRDGIVIMLNGIFEHTLIFPELLKMGYSPFDEEERGTTKQLGRLSSRDFPRQDSTPSPRNISALVYARSYLECQSQAVRSLCDSVFSDSSFAETKNLGLNIVETVRKYAKNDVAQFTFGLNECLRILNETEFIQIEATNGA